MPTQPALRLAAGRARAAELMPYLASALFAMTAVEAPGLGTFGVDRHWRLSFDPQVCLTLSAQECAGVWLHEVGHLLREHAARWDALLDPMDQHGRWNAAADAAINADLRQARVALPAGAWYPELIPGAAPGMGTEVLYRLLRQAPPAAPPDCGSGAGGARREWERGDPVEGGGGVDEGRAALLRHQVARDVADHLRSRGRVPLGWARWAQGVLAPQVDWRAELRSVAARTTASVAGLRDHTYARPSRRAASVPGVVLPALRQPRPPLVRVVVDTSASMSEAMLGACLGEVSGILARVGRAGRGLGGRGSVEVIACDACADRVQVVRDAGAITLVGGGGTDLRVGIEVAAARRPAADLVIVMTDGDTPWPTQPPLQNPRARYVAVLISSTGSPGSTVGAGRPPSWMHSVVVPSP